MKARRGRWLVRAAAVALGVLLSVLALEGLVRLVPPAHAGGREQVFPPGHMMHPRRGFYVLDGEEGFRPSRTHPEYAAHGALKNDYPMARRAGVPRVLNIGDSVTHRGRIVGKLAELAPEIEWWNAGVGGWNTRQEAAYLERIGDAIAPDLVLVYLHLNDFEVTPVRFVDSEDRFVEFHPSRPRVLSRFWFVRSALYRLWVSWTDAPSGEEDLAEEVFTNLTRMERHAGQRGWAFAVAVLPPFAATDTLPEPLRSLCIERMARSLAWLGSNGIAHFDLREPVEATVRAGLPVDELPGDVLHPSWEAGEAMARYLLAAGLAELATSSSR
ncbi:MAG: hypothetical protein GC161_11000 [Planctomycetaceae bacterium]|nr:hypothetical protein [Planctomycetaceae bacterium]